jgi:hypothetical protein
MKTEKHIALPAKHFPAIKNPIHLEKPETFLQQCHHRLA